MIAMIVIIKNKEGQTTGALTVKVGERVEFGRYTSASLPHVRIPPMIGTGNGIITHEFSGEVVITSPGGEVLSRVYAKDYMEKEVDNGADN